MTEGASLTAIQFVALILATIGLLLALALGTGIPYSLVAFAAGLAVSFVPGVPQFHLEPQIVLGLMLPPLLYNATVNTSVQLVRFTLVSGVLLGAVLVPATIGAVALTAHALVPDLGWVSAVLLGVVASVSETRLLREIGKARHLPRVIADVLRGQELVAPAMIVSTLLLAIDAASSGTPSATDLVIRYAGDLIGGGALGLAIGWGMSWLRRRVDIVSIEIAVSVATPYLAALAAEALGLAVPVPILVAGLVVSALFIDRRTGRVGSSSQARLVGRVFWDEASLVISGILFFLAGYALPEALAALEVWSVWRLAGVTAALLAVVLLVQFVFSLLATALPPADAVVRRFGLPRARIAAASLMTWSPTRSVIGLMIAFSIPLTLENGEPFPDRSLVLVIAALLIVGSTLVQGLMLPWIVRRTALGPPDEDEQEERLARAAMAEAAAKRTADIFGVERRALLDLRAANRIGDAVLYRLLEEVDLQSVARKGELTDQAAS